MLDFKDLVAQKWSVWVGIIMASFGCDFFEQITQQKTKLANPDMISCCLPYQ